MQSKNENVARLITIRSWIALGLIGLFVTASFLVLGRAIRLQAGGFAMVEIAANQRIWSQQISFLANTLAHSTDPEERQISRNALHKAVGEMARQHDILSLRTGSERVPADMRSILQDIYHADLNPFDAQVSGFLQSARRLLGTTDKEFGADMPDVIELNVNVGPILQTHELLAGLLRREASTEVNRVLLLGAMLWLATLALLIIEVPLIFRPMARQASANLKRADAARKAAEDYAAAADVAREGHANFIRTMSHELRTPLNAILGMAQLLRMQGLPPKEEEYAHDIYQAGSSLLELINGILEFSRLEAGQVNIEKRKIVLDEEVARTISIFRSLAKRKGLEMTSEIDPRLAGNYWADGSRIHQILVNLVGNAVKFTKEGSINIRAGYAGPVQGASDLVCFQVKDTGIGIPASVQDRIFEEFQQADRSLGRKYGGSGLGLAICSRLVRLMGGQIGVESREGEGSLFWFTLPLERMSSAEPPSKQPDPLVRDGANTH